MEPIKKNRRDNQESKKRRMKKSGLGFVKAIKRVYERIQGGK